MRDRDIEILIKLAKRKLAAGISKEEALYSLQKAGILDEMGELSPGYQHIGLDTSHSYITVRNALNFGGGY
jgi:hypothetical protein